MGEKDRIIPIEDGTTLDHIAAWRSPDILKILGIKEGANVTTITAINVPSKKLKRKDIVMIEERELKKKETDIIALISPNATINLIRGSEVIDKYKVELPEEIEGLIECPNPTCISNVLEEPIVSKFIVVEKHPLRIRCFYCDKVIEEADIPADIIIK
jgi:aspartate carbamoyltransferase regulatory subunit